jgi:hypothetical protein
LSVSSSFASSSILDLVEFRSKSLSYCWIFASSSAIYCFRRARERRWLLRTRSAFVSYSRS